MPTARQKERVSPGRRVRPSRRAAAKRRLVTLLRWRAMSSPRSLRSRGVACSARR